MIRLECEEVRFRVLRVAIKRGRFGAGEGVICFYVSALYTVWCKNWGTDFIRVIIRFREYWNRQMQHTFCYRFSCWNCSGRLQDFVVIAGGTLL